MSCAVGTPTFTEIAHLLPAQSSVTQQYDLRAFDVSAPGTYRIYITHGTQQYAWDAFSAPFTLKRNSWGSYMASHNGAEKYIFGDLEYDRATLALDRNLKQFTFTYSMFSSHIPTGQYTLDDKTLTLIDREDESVYVFDVVDGGFAFNAEKSAELPTFRYESESEEMSSCVPGGAIFRKVIDRTFAVNSAWAGYSENTELYRNYDYGTYSELQHLPVWRIRSEWGIENFKNRFDRTVTFTESWNDTPSFDGIIQGYDNEWFRANSLLVTYVPSKSSHFRYTVEKLAYENYGEILTLFVKTEYVQDAGDTEMGGYWLFVEVSNEYLAESEVEDAVLDVYIPETVPGNVTNETEAVKLYKNMLENLFEKEYRYRLDRNNSYVAKELANWKSDTYMQELYQTDANSVMQQYRADLNNLLLFRTRGSWIAPVAPETYEEARAYILKEFKRLLGDEERKAEMESVLDAMKTHVVWTEESLYEENPQKNFDWARAYIWARYLQSYNAYQMITQ